MFDFWGHRGPCTGEKDYENVNHLGVSWGDTNQILAFCPESWESRLLKKTVDIFCFL